MNIGELFCELGFDVDDASLKDFTSKIVQGRNEILEMSAAATAAVYALNSLFSSSANNAMEIKNFTDQLGYNGQELQKWQTVIHETNPSVGLEEAYRGYYKLGELLRDIRQGKGNSGALAMLGVQYDTKMSPEQALDQVASHIEQIISQYGAGYASDKLNAIGIGAGSLNAIRLYAKNRAQFEQMGSAGIESESTIEANSHYAKSIAQLDVEWRNFKDTMTAKWADTVVAEIHKADDGFHEFLKNIQIVYEWLGTHPILSRITEIGAIGLAGFWAITSFPVTTAFIALAAAIDDVGKAMRGLPSYTTDAIAGFSLLKKDPALAGNNFLASVDKLMGKDINDPSLHWFGGMTPGGVNQTNHTTIHLQGLTPSQLEDHVDYFHQKKIDDANATTNLGAPY